MNLLVFPISIAYLELVNALMSKLSVNVAGSVLCAVAAGLLLNIPCFILKRSKWLVFALLEALCFFFCIEYFTNASYYVFMSPGAILEAGGGVANEFGDAVIDVIKGGILNIIALQLPAIIVLIVNHKGNAFDLKRSDLNVLILLLAAVFFQSLGTEAQLNYNDELYTYAYNYDGAVKSFGVGTAVLLDAKYSVSGVPDIPKELLELEEPEAVVHDPEYSYNMIDYDFEALLAGTEDPNIKKMLEYISVQKASKQNEYTGLFKGKNIIFITAESFSSELIREDINPTLYRMATRGIVVEDYYQPFWGGSTSTGEASLLLGRIPTDGVNTLLDVAEFDNSYTLANKLKERRYYTAAMHSGHFDYYSRQITHPALGYDDWVARETGMDIPATWPGDDLATVEFSFNLYKDKDPYCIYYMSYSGHGLYNYTGNEISMKYKDVIDALELDYSEKLQAYFAANYCFELSLDSLISQLDEAGQLEDTVIVISSDHYPYALQKGDAWKNSEDYLSELYGYSYENNMKRDHSSLIIWTPELEEYDEPITVSGPSYSVDVLPTLLNLFGIEYDSRLYVGRDLLSDTEPLAVWIDGSWKSSLGYYDAPSQKFLPEDGAEFTEEYIDKMKAVVAGKIDFSRKMTQADLFEFLDSVSK